MKLEKLKKLEPYAFVDLTLPHSLKAVGFNF